PRDPPRPPPSLPSFPTRRSSDLSHMRDPMPTRPSSSRSRNPTSHNSAARRCAVLVGRPVSRASALIVIRGLLRSNTLSSLMTRSTTDSPDDEFAMVSPGHLETNPDQPATPRSSDELHAPSR